MLLVLVASTLRPELRWPEIKPALEWAIKENDGADKDELSTCVMKQASEKPSRKLVERAIGRLGVKPEIDVILAGTWCWSWWCCWSLCWSWKIWWWCWSCGDEVWMIGVVEIDNGNKRCSCQNDIKRPPHPKWLQQGSWQRWVHRLSCLRGDFSHDNYDDNYCGDLRPAKQKNR